MNVGGGIATEPLANESTAGICHVGAAGHTAGRLDHSGRGGRRRGAAGCVIGVTRAGTETPDRRAAPARAVRACFHVSELASEPMSTGATRTRTPSARKVFA